MNLKIAIVEDDETQLAYVKALMEQYFTGSQNIVKIFSCESAEEFLFKYSESLDFDLILLDIKLRKMNGMELAKQIRMKDRIVQLAFLTGVKDYVFEGYEVGAVRYLIKPVQEQDLFKLLDDTLTWKECKKDEYFVFPYQGESVRIPYSEIIYIDMLDNRFCLANRSTVINLEHVARITLEQCCFENGQAVPVSRGCYNTLNEAFISFYL